MTDCRRRSNPAARWQKSCSITRCATGSAHDQRSVSFDKVREAWASIPAPPDEDMRLMESGWGAAYLGTFLMSLEGKHARRSGRTMKEQVLIVRLLNFRGSVIKEGRNTDDAQAEWRRPAR